MRRRRIVDSHYDGVSVEDSYRCNDVTFVYAAPGGAPGPVAVVGTFGDLNDPVPLEPGPSHRSR